MFIRPYTISGVALVLLQLYSAGYFLFISFRSTSKPRRTDRQLALLLIVWATLATHVTVLAIHPSPLVSMSRYLRGFQAMVLLGIGIRFLYMLAETNTTAFIREQKVAARCFLVFVAVEVAFTLLRYRSGLSTGLFPTRPLILEMPLVALTLWSIFLSARLGLYVEQTQQPRSFTARFRQFFSSPQVRLGRFLRNVFVAMLTSLLLLVIFIFAQLGDTAIWRTNLSDGIAMSMTLLIVFGYLRLVQDDVGIELRVTGVGLTLFLIFSSSLGWLIARVFIGQRLPNVSLNGVLGAVNSPDFTINPAFLPVAQDLHELLVPLLWFEVLGSIGFILLYRIFFRRTISVVIDALMGGIDQIEQGNLAHRITEDWPGEAGRIARAFNQMSTSLNHSNEEISRYQHSLSDMVETRTRQLALEITQRKSAELREGIQAERSRIARDAHDGSLQQFLALRMRLRSRRLRQLDPPALATELDDIANDILAGAQELRQLIESLETAWLNNSIDDAITEIASRFRKASEIHLDVRINPDLPSIGDEKRLTLLRVLQESLSNVARHSQATTCLVTLSVETAERDMLLLSVGDDGVGIPLDKMSSDQSNGHGLKNMQHRANMDDGSLRISYLHPQDADQQPVGTTIELRLPL